MLLTQKRKRESGTNSRHHTKACLRRLSSANDFHEINEITVLVTVSICLWLTTAVCQQGGMSEDIYSLSYIAHSLDGLKIFA